MKKKLKNFRVFESPPLGGFRGQKRLLSMFLCIFVFFSCKDQSYLHHKLKLEKIADNCADGQQSFQMNSNINGERYEFNKCLDENFESTSTIFSRQGDTLVVRFENNSNLKQSEFHITLDIDTYPRYNFLTIDGDTFIIVPTSAKN